MSAFQHLILRVGLFCLEGSSRMRRSAVTGDTGVFPQHFNGLHKFNDDYVSQLVRRLEELDISRGNPNDEGSVHSCRAILEREASHCSGGLESPSFLEELSSTRPRMLTQRWGELKLQFETRGTLQQIQPLRQVQSTPSLRITPIQLSNSHELKTRWWVNREGLSMSEHWAANIDEQGQRDWYVNGTTPAYHSNDSDISDQERGNTLPARGSPLGMDLRPEPFDRDPDIPSGEAGEVQQVYPAVLPGPLKWLHMTLSMSSTEETEDQPLPGVHVHDPSVSAIASRLIELERLQAATVLRERVRTGRSRPATAVPIMRCCSRPRKPEPADPRSEFSGRGECRSVVSDFTDVTPLDSGFVTHKTTRSVRTKRRSKMTPKQLTVPTNRPCSCSQPKSEKHASAHSPGSSPVSVKPTPHIKTKPLKTAKKRIPRKPRTDFTKGHKSKA
ncbi:hypothetical protein ACEWY4_006445 [Coilia grayii]|uniref:Uncharacterized protein n=1 Tax=Coilia grayii TaxID=363190 RepID=A0ABD1KDS1_9TELE